MHALGAGRAARGAGQGHAQDMLAKLLGLRSARCSSSIGGSPGWGWLGTMPPVLPQAGDAAAPSPRAHRSTWRDNVGPEAEETRHLHGARSCAGLTVLGMRIGVETTHLKRLARSLSQMVAFTTVSIRTAVVRRVPFLKVCPDQFHLGILPQELLTLKLAVAAGVDNIECVLGRAPTGEICEVNLDLEAVVLHVNKQPMDSGGLFQPAPAESGGSDGFPALELQA
ncbi:hypothetical protein H4582DRAFT_2051285 [Lactarius indigo]|nr:hypothetical protein H4582DRAFT_2051285 [Lactarius indigo]